MNREKSGGLTGTHNDVASAGMYFELDMPRGESAFFLRSMQDTPQGTRPEHVVRATENGRERVIVKIEGNASEEQMDILQRRGAKMSSEQDFSDLAATQDYKAPGSEWSQPQVYSWGAHCD